MYMGGNIRERHYFLGEGGGGRRSGRVATYIAPHEMNSLLFIPSVHFVSTLCSSGKKQPFQYHASAFTCAKLLHMRWLVLQSISFSYSTFFLRSLAVCSLPFPAPSTSLQIIYFRIHSNVHSTLTHRANVWEFCWCEVKHVCVHRVGWRGKEQNQLIKNLHSSHHTLHKSWSTSYFLCCPNMAEFHQ